MTPREQFAEKQKQSLTGRSDDNRLPGTNPKKPVQRKKKPSAEIRLPDSFVAAYAKQQPDWGPLGWVTYKRTYARWADEDMKRREEWHETVRRVVGVLPDVLAEDGI